MNKEHLDIEALSRYFLGDMSLAEERETRAHLSECGECRKKLSDMRKIHSAFFGEPEKESIPQSSLKTFFSSTWTRIAAIVILLFGIGLAIHLIHGPKGEQPLTTVSGQMQDSLEKCDTAVDSVQKNQ